MAKLTHSELVTLGNEYIETMLKSGNKISDDHSVRAAFMTGFIHALAIKKLAKIYPGDFAWSFYNCVGQVEERNAFFAGYEKAIELKN